MPSKISKLFVYCVGNPSFDPEKAVADHDTHEAAVKLLNEKNDFEGAIRLWFGLPEAGKDDYVYHAVASVTLPQVQRAVAMGRENGLHGWYDGQNKTEGDASRPPPLPSTSDIQSYTSLFSPSSSSSPTSSLKSFVSNAKKDSIRALVSSNLLSKRCLHPSFSGLLQIPKVKNLATIPLNPYLDFWVWSCSNLEWCGPVGEQGLKSHHVLPVLMHHFGCVVPSHEALGIIKKLAEGAGRGTTGKEDGNGVVDGSPGNGTAAGKKPKSKKAKREKPPPPMKVLDVGSGNGYWSFMLRQYGLETIAVDNMQSEWRVNWVPDTNLTTGTSYLKSSLPASQHKNHILLLVYPITGSDGTGSFTRELMDVYKGDVVVVAGTQNGNGYTSFGKGKGTMDEYMMGKKQGSEWEKIAQVPLPSFAGRDEGLSVYVRRDKTGRDGEK
ncbi:hypothetical protein QBC36DRAFT_323708 [Triangularia setosa]|uniref:Uncharacterized protein n=1 Tax=Triangularia setosa TaxID=2587417 RepID=A0AAN6WC18_9PEZI|nr:hypothetical protein QBC36DRAFT_323708 [Podospora setosa]